jgi:hypothetical protein
VATELATSRAIDASIDAYFGWPGFFTLLSSFTALAGFEDAQSLMKWAPVANELALLLPLLVIFRALTSDRRLVWSAIVMFYLANWVDQDYLAPQAMSFFLYLCILALLLTFFGPDESSPALRRHRLPGLTRMLQVVRGPGPPHRAVSAAASGPASRIMVVLIVVLMSSAVVVMHQLTPFAVTMALASLWIARRTPLHRLPLITGLLTVAWLTYGGLSYLEGHFVNLLAQVGDVQQAADAGLADRVQGSEGHLLVVQSRLLFSLTIWGLAGIAILLYYLRGKRDTTAVLLFASPVPLFALQSYGGEMLLRIFLFSLPFACFLAVQLLPPADSALRRRAAGVAFFVGSLALAPAFVLVHYGNQIVDLPSVREVAAVKELYRLAPTGSVLVAGNDSTPWRFTEYDDHRHRTIRQVVTEQPVPDARAVEQILRKELISAENGGFVLITRRQHAFERVFGSRTPYTLGQVERRLEQSDAFRVVFRNADAVILQLKEPT